MKFSKSTGILKFTSLIVFSLLLLSAIPKNENEILSITHGTSFGMCRGYCIHETVYTAKKIKTYNKKWSGKGTRKHSRRNTTAFWNSLIRSVDTDRFFALNTVYGCPDCADGGSEWIEIHTKTKSHTVRFDFRIERISTLNKLLLLLRETEKK